MKTTHNLYTILTLLFVAVSINSLRAQCSVTFTATPDGLGANGVQFIAPTTVGGQIINFYQWDFGDGSATSFIAQSTYHHNFPVSGAYSVQLKVYTDEICTGTQPVVVNDPTSGCNASFTYQPSLTNWGSYELQAQASSSNPPITYIWNFGATASTETFQVNGASDEVCLTIYDNSGCSATFCDTLVAGSPVLVPIYYIDVDSQTTCNNVIAVPISFVNGSCQGQLISEPAGSVDFDQMQVSGDTLFFTVCDDAQLIGITDSTGIICSYLEIDFTLDLGNIDHSKQTKIYPNPAHDFVTIQMDELTEIVLFDELGRYVKSFESFGSSTILDLQNIESGIYLLYLKKNDGSISIDELILK